MRQSRTFKLLIGTGAVLALLFGVALARTMTTGCPEGHDMSTLACLFLPTPMDLGTHILSYAFIGTIALGTSAGLLLWRRQWARINSLTISLSLMQAPEKGLRPLIHCLGLEGKICVVNSEAPLCFCAGFISPRIYVSQGTIAKLTPEELEALFLHEKHHLTNRVPLKILAGRCIASVLFFIPLLRDLLQRYLIEAEIAADESAIRQQGHRRGIASALEKLTQHYPASPVPGTAIGAADALAYRIDYLIGESCAFPIHVSRIIISLIVTTLILTAILIPLPSSHPISDHVANAVSIYLGQGVGP